jgi:hypothetical protein
LKYVQSLIFISGLNLNELSDATIEPLSNFSHIPTVTRGVPFEQKAPSLRLFLSNNPLTRAPGAVFNVDLLVELSLRNTHITSLPPAIGRLRNLEKLNIAQTRLRYLPAELLGLMKYGGKLKELQMQPNTFYQPARMELITKPKLNGEQQAEMQAEAETLSGNSAEQRQEGVLAVTLDSATVNEIKVGNHEGSWRSPRWYVALLARSSVQYSDSRGVITSTFRLPELPPENEAANLDKMVVDNEPLMSNPAGAALTSSSHVPSLFELALQACSRTSALPTLASYLPCDAPSHVPALLDRIVEQGKMNGNTGTLPCSNCGKPVVVPVAQWLEWWYVRCVATDIKPGEELIWLRVPTMDIDVATPFLKRACSSRCLPKPAAFRTQLDGTLPWVTKRIQG